MVRHGQSRVGHSRGVLVWLLVVVLESGDGRGLLVLALGEEHEHLLQCRLMRPPHHSQAGRSADTELLPNRPSSTLVVPWLDLPLPPLS